MERLGIQETWVKLVYLVRKEMWVRKGIRAPLVPLDPQESEAHPERTDPKETQALLDFPETQDLLERQVRMVLMVDQEQREIMESLGKLDHQGLLENLDLLDHQGGGVI